MGAAYRERARTTVRPAPSADVAPRAEAMRLAEEIGAILLDVACLSIPAVDHDVARRHARFRVGDARQRVGLGDEAVGEEVVAAQSARVGARAAGAGAVVGPTRRACLEVLRGDHGPPSAIGGHVAGDRDGRGRTHSIDVDDVGT